MVGISSICARYNFKFTCLSVYLRVTKFPQKNLFVRSRYDSQRENVVLQEYRKHVEERAAEGVVPKPLSAEQTAELVELIKAPIAGEEEFLLDLLTNRVPPGVDDAAYVKAGFLAAVAKGEAQSPILSAARAAELLGTMLGGYNIPANDRTAGQQ